MPAVLVPVAALLLGAGILLLGNGLQGLLLPIRATIEAFSTQSIGLIGSAYPVGFVFSCLYTPHVVKRVGHIRSFAVFAAIAAVVVLLYGLVVHPAVWIALRVVSGFSFAGLFMVIESWLNEASSNSNRGQIFSIYMVVNLSTVTCGQLLIMTGDPARLDLFVLAAIAIILGLVPVALTSSSGPPPIQRVRLRWGRLYRMSPVGVMGCFFVGMANGAFGSFGAVFAKAAGLTVVEIALFMSMTLIGGALAQVPVGRVSDRFDRRQVIVGGCIIASLVGLIMMAAGDARTGGRLLAFDPGMGALPPGSLIALAFLFGASIHPIYGLCTAHTNDFVERSDFVEASSGLLLTWGIGAAVGPILAAQYMERLGLGGLFLFTASVHLVCALFAVYRMRRRAAPPLQTRDSFVTANAAARTTPVASTLDPRAPLDEAPVDDARAA
jgi:MFS family permease